jgi:hypothetical protein
VREGVNDQEQYEATVAELKEKLGQAERSINVLMVLVGLLCIVSLVLVFGV